MIQNLRCALAQVLVAEVLVEVDQHASAEGRGVERIGVVGMVQVVVDFCALIDFSVVQLLDEEVDRGASDFGVLVTESVFGRLYKCFNAVSCRDDIRVTRHTLCVEVLNLVSVAATEAAIALEAFVDEPLGEVVGFGAGIEPSLNLLVGARIGVEVQIRHRKQRRSLVVSPVLDAQQRPDVDRRPFDEFLNDQVHEAILDGGSL